MVQACWEKLGVERRTEKEPAVLRRHSMLTLIDRFTWSRERRSKTPPLVPDRKVHGIRVSPKAVPKDSDSRFSTTSLTYENSLRKAKERMAYPFPESTIKSGHGTESFCPHPPFLRSLST